MDPASLTDEELDAAINNPNPAPDPEPAPTPAPDVPPTPNPSEEPVPEPAPEPADPPQPDPAPEPEEEPKPPSRRESLRIQQLLGKYGTPEDAPKTRPQPRDGALNYEEELDADPATIERLRADREAAENARYQEGLSQAQNIEWRTLLQIDAPQIESKYPQLDKNSTEFHPALANSLSSWYLTMSGYDPQTRSAANPGMRWTDFIEGVMELADEIAATKQQTTTKNVANQAANTGLRPSGTTAKLDLSKPPELMTDEELDAVMALLPKHK
jgi:hypothetical protein